MATIQGLTGKQILPTSVDYAQWRYQYATSTHLEDHDMSPGLIVQPHNKEDIKIVIAYAKSQKKAIAIRTGGHQYSGASSTGGENIQLDLRSTFQAEEDLTYFEKEGKSFVRASVSHGLGEFNAFLGKHGVFVPHGQCTDVHLGGHIQTGGYGQLGRSFGLIGDHVRSLEIIDHASQEQEITLESDPEQFYAWLGGSPGNMGVLTHVTLEVHRDSDYVGSMGLKVVHLYEEGTLKRMMQILANMSANTALSRSYDYCVTVLSTSFDLRNLWPGNSIDRQMEEAHPEIYGDDGVPFWPRSIVVYAQFVPFPGSDEKPDMKWFESIRDGAWFEEGVMEKPMSQLTAQWIFRDTREYNLPYVKRTYLTDSTSLDKSGWVDWVSGRINEAVAPLDNGLWLSVQIQAFGGKHSQFALNADNGTSYSWRDSTMVMVLDCFHDPSAKAAAEEWQAVNDKEAIGPTSVFSTQDRRVLWGSYGSYDLHASRQFYYEDEAKYERLMKARQVADPDGTFTANTFCVKRAGDEGFLGRLMRNAHL